MVGGGVGHMLVWRRGLDCNFKLIRESLTEKVAWKQKPGNEGASQLGSRAEGLPGRKDMCRDPKAGWGAPGRFGEWQGCKCGCSEGARGAGAELRVRRVQPVSNLLGYFGICAFCCVWSEAVWGSWAEGWYDHSRCRVGDRLAVQGQKQGDQWEVIAKIQVRCSWLWTISFTPKNWVEEL